jgi:hypothetical protein
LNKVGSNWYLQSQLLPPTVSVACTPAELFDAANQVSTCTLTFSQAAPAQGLSVNLNLPTANPRYSTTCPQTITIPAGALTTTCTIVATPNTEPNDGDVLAELSIAPASAAGVYEPAGTPAQVLVRDDDSQGASAKAIPASGYGSLLLLSVGLGGAGMLFARRQKQQATARKKTL